MTRRFRTCRDPLRYRQIRLPAGEFYADTMFSTVTSIRGHTCAQIYGNKFGFIKAYPLPSKDAQNIGDSLSLMIQEVGVMNRMHTDNASEMVGRNTPFFKRARKEGIDLTSIEPKRHNENYGEILVKKAKELSCILMHTRNVPLRLWCYALEYACELASLQVPGMFRNRGRSGYELVFGNTPDISEYVEFDFYQYCWYWDTPLSYPHGPKQLGRWLGIAHRVGQAMVFYVVNENGKVIARSTVTTIKDADFNTEEMIKRRESLDTVITKSLGDFKSAINEKEIQIPELSENDLLGQLSFAFNIDRNEIDTSSQKHYGETERPDMDDAPNMDVESEEFDKFLGVHIEIPSSDGEGKVLARVTGRKRDGDGNMIGTFNENPILNTAIYEVESPDGTIAEYTANIIAQNLYSQIDDDGYNYDLLFEIIGHRTDGTEVKKENGKITSSTGVTKRVITTKGW